MRLGIDYDGVVADTNAVKSTWLRENLGVEIPAWRTDRTTVTPIIGAEEYRRMGDAVFEEELTLSAPEVPGSITSLFQLRYRGNELILISARIPRRLDYSKQWLYANGIYYAFSGFEATKDADGNEVKSKEEVCIEHGLDGLIDDDLRHLEAIRLSNFRRILLKHGSDEELNLKDIQYAMNWEQALTIL